MSFIKYIFRRILAMIPVVFGVLALTFILSRLMPGDPVTALLSAKGNVRPSQDVVEAMKRQLGLDQPLIIQFFRFLVDLFTGQWGVSVSIARNQKVWILIMKRFPRTLDLTIFSMVIAGFVGIKTGTISAVHRNETKDTVYRGLALVGVSIPVFFLGMLVQYYIAYVVDLFPATGYKSAGYVDPPFITGFFIIDAALTGNYYLIIDYLYHLALPVLCLAFITLAGIVRQTRSSMLEVLEMDYIRTARAKGCNEKDVINTHALKNALIPTVTLIGMNVATLLSGAVLTEITFGLVGMGSLLVKAITLKDYWVLNALVFIIAIVFTVSNLITDILYAYLDPRIRY
ncbi:MAG: putative D,D-dipeptide transport system permease protein DdpB [Promethearchaeota archaeon]|nr:MAG: putative D,D-dipeptide transport system permease protein DdpB [Candidatus Lokiarchaeota archaeon]